MSNTVFTDVRAITIREKDVKSIHNASTGRTIWEKKASLNAPLKFEGYFTGQGFNHYVLVSKYHGANPTLFKSFDGVTWEPWDGSRIDFNDTEVVYVKGDNPDGFNTKDAIANFQINTCVVSGDVMSLIGEDIHEIPNAYCFYKLFSREGHVSLPSVIQIELSATVLKENCYMDMFYDLPHEIIIDKLPATTLAKECYSGMFTRCTGLEVAPELPATTLAEGCYSGMFGNCTNLIQAPELPAEDLKFGCYMMMFTGCANLDNIKCLAKRPSEESEQYLPGYDTYQWLRGVSETGTFTKSAEATFWESGQGGIPTGWTVIEVD